MRNLLLSVVTAVLLSAGIVPYTASCSGCGDGKDSVADVKAVRTDTVARIVMEVSRQARLYTTEAVIHKLVTYSDAPSLEGKIMGIPVKVPTRVRDRKIAIPIDVTLNLHSLTAGTWNAVTEKLSSPCQTPVWWPRPRRLTTKAPGNMSTRCAHASPMQKKLHWPNKAWTAS